MIDHIYLISQLPALYFDKTPAMDAGRFIDEAEKWLSRRDMKQLTSVRLFDMETEIRFPKAVQQVLDYERTLRKDLAEWRIANRKGTEYKPESFSPALLREGNPLENEKKLLLLRWKFIEDMEQDHHFDLVLLMLYFLKLQILQKLAEYNKDKGMERFQKISKGSE